MKKFSEATEVITFFVTAKVIYLISYFLSLLMSNRLPWMSFNQLRRASSASDGELQCRSIQSVRFNFAVHIQSKRVLEESFFSFFYIEK
jgi:hypothetical protein